MLKFLLDEHISPSVVAGLKRRMPHLTAYALTDWHEGAFLGQDDSNCLKAAAGEGLILVTYDRRTIPPLLKSWAEQGVRYAGVVFIDERTISQADIGGQVKALLELAKAARAWDWTDRICFLERGASAGD